jgi:hypothetical protein
VTDTGPIAPRAGQKSVWINLGVHPAIEPDGPTSLGPMPGEYLMAPMTAWHSWTLPTSRQ